MKNYNTPKEITEEFANSGIYKSDLPLSKFSLIAILGGVFIAFGGLLSVMVAGGMPGVGADNPGLIKFIAGALFPVGLIIVSVTGADLFTSDCTAFTLPLLEKRLKTFTLIKLLILSYLFNFVGSQVVAYLLSSGVGLFDKDPWQHYLHHYAEVKVNQDFMTVFIKGIGANWLVCLGMWMGYAAKDIIGKCIGIWIPVMLFVTLGYEHSIANMFFIPAAIYSGADILWSDFILHNLIPATLGNLIGGAVLVGCVYWYLYSRKK
ncbi:MULTISPECIES: formate/nitrite transporter family protein [unclassified Dysgonomonas]|jgi:formate/nitrite transporter|uniref:formate/nitrite transporter family protein n=1 Tax=unclassified Dysgonomonas TaxID=2630389 RepID=UPI0025C04EB7|nr:MULTISPECIES: formate/nitrite transporter family protein [unclassified Dysgonomonas]MDR2005489.1 formate/nitrite transporter family protein [Prevotella sp.]HMM02459.1 formate/nitrite transporter family protein [Dysgonomonas sp.]